MSRRLAGVALAGSSVLLGVSPSQGDTPPAPLLPLATCESRVNDGPGDGIPTLSVIDVQPVPLIADPRGNVSGLDITSITLRVTETRVYAFMALADIPDTHRQTDSAHGYIMWFSRNGKIARFEHLYTNPALAAQGLAPASGAPTATVGTTTAGGEALTGIGGDIDKAKNVAYVYADRKSVEDKMGGPLVDDDEITAISGRTELWETDGKAAAGPARRPADTTNATPAQATWKVGDDRCFPATAVTAPEVKAQFGDRVTLAATLKDAAGAPLANRPVSFAVPGESARTATTDAAGLARAVLDAAPAAGSYAFKVTFAGDDASGRGQATGTLTVRTETIRMAKLAVRKSGTARIVTATLTEDDPRAFGKQPVAWYVNGKKVATVNTDATGRSVFKGAKAGQKVQARYAGKSGRYAPVVSNTVTV